MKEWFTWGRPGRQKLILDLYHSCSSLLRTKVSRVFVLSCFALAVLAFGGYAWAKKTVILQIDGQEKKIQTYNYSVADLLKSQRITLSQNDEVIPSLSTPLKENMRVEVNHSAMLTITADKQSIDVFSCRNTVGEVLTEKEISFGPQDLVEPAPETIVTDGIKIKITRVNVKEEIKEAQILPTIKKETDPNLLSGITRVTQSGKNGLEKQKWQITYHDGQEVERRLTENIILKPAVERVVKVGTLRQVSRGGLDIRFSRALDVIATAYSHTGYNTSSGTAPRFGVAAVDPQVIPMGSRLYIEGYGYATALDRGSAIVGARIDVFLDTAEQARRWGVRKVRVYILD